MTGIVLGILVVLLVGFHFWFQAHAKRLLEDMVESKSNGKLKLKIQKLRFSYFSRKIELEKAVFYNTDTLTGTTAYHFEVDKMQLQAKAVLPIIFKKQIMIDSLRLLNPHIEVSRLRPGLKPDKKEKKDVSIPEEMGKVYKSIQDALQLLQVQRFEIENGTFTLLNKFDPEQLPLVVSNIYFHIDNLAVDSKHTGKEKILFSDNVVLKSKNQDILFPDGRHRLSFRNFSINLKNKLVAFDSCTIAATKSDSTAASFNVFFDLLLLTNIDFDTLYKAEVIKADSVYCLNPTFTLDVKLGSKKEVKKDPPKLENIIQQLTGNLLLGNVVVNNASFNIKTVKDGNPSTFTFSNNNFEMQGLSIDQQANKPISVRSFAMAIRNYENFIKDSAYSVKFDSVLFKDNRITLSNFLFTKLDNGKILNTFSVPQFNLLGMSWDDLVFDRKLKADQAILFNPSINYTVSAKKNKPGKQTIFQSLGVANEYMDLQQIDIINGAIDLRLKNNLRIKLDQATVSVKSHSLLESKKLSAIKNSLLQLRFNNGIIQAGNLSIKLQDIQYLGNSGHFSASSVNVINKEKSTTIDLQGVSVDEMRVDEGTGNVHAEGVKWTKGTIHLNSGVGKTGKGGSSVTLKDVQGANTTITGLFGNKTVATTLNSISISDLEKNPGTGLLLNGLAVNGRELNVSDPAMKLRVADYSIRDNQTSSFHQLSYNLHTAKTHATITIPSLQLVPHVQPLLDGRIAVDEIRIEKPVMNIALGEKNSSSSTEKKPFPLIDISAIKITQPSIIFSQARDSGMLILNWQAPGNGSNFIEGAGLHTKDHRLSLDNLNFFLTDFVYANPKGKKISTGDGKLSASINDIRFDQQNDEPLEWKANISRFAAKDFILDSFGKANAKLVLNTGTIQNLDISSSTILNLQDLAAANRAFQVKDFTGHYADSVSSLVWSNAAFNRHSNIFSMDSFSLRPLLSRDSFIARQSFQADYTTLRSGRISIGPLDIDRYIKDKTLNTRSVTVDDLFFYDYKDKRLPFNPGLVKPLAVNMLKNIPQKMNIDTIHFTNANVEYTEVNEKTKKAGTVPITRMDVKLFTVKNYNIKPTDSLGIHATGYLMDTAWVRLRVKESYTDSLGGFLMTVLMKPADFRVLNPVLIPLASAKIESGYLDTLTMRAIGREYLSWGEMQMYYHDLKVRILKNSDDKKKNFINGLISFLANTFIIKNNNSSRTGHVFFIRNRERSAINYLIKIALSGMASSVGVKKNKKLMRQYKRELDERKLPPIDFDYSSQAFLIQKISFRQQAKNFRHLQYLTQ